MEKIDFENFVEGEKKEKGKGKEKEEEDTSKWLALVESDDEVEFIGETRPLYINKNQKEKIVSRIGDKLVRVGASNQALDGFLVKGSGSQVPNLQMDNGNTDDQTACCHPRGHLRILDEQIGVVCKFCPVVFMEMKHIYPDFAKTSSRRHDRRFLGESEHSEEEDEEGKGKWLALVDVGDANRNNDTKCLALLGSDEGSDGVEFIGETRPLYNNKNEMKRVMSMNVDIDEGGGDKLALVVASNQPLDGFWLKTCSGSKVGSVGGRSPRLITYDEVAASSTTKRRRVDSISLSDVESTDSEEGGSLKVCEKRKGIVSRLRSSSNSKSLKKDARKKRSYSDFCLDDDSKGEDNGAENAPTLPLKFGFPVEGEKLPVKEDWEKENENLFAELNMGIEPETSSINQSMMDNGNTDDATACCHPKGHLRILDEQIGVVCKYCPVVFQEIKHIFPDFAKKPNRRHDRSLFVEPEHSDVSDFESDDASTNSCAQDRL